MTDTRKTAWIHTFGMEKNLFDPFAYSPPPLLPELNEDAPKPQPAPALLAPPAPIPQQVQPPAPAKPRPAPWRPSGSLPALKPTLKGFDVPQTRDAGAMAKMQLIRDRIVRPALTETLPHTRAVLAEILQGATAATNGHNRGQRALVDRIFYWIRGRVRYVLDPRGRELFQALGVTLKEGLGDCDDFTGALAALLKAAGLRVKARCIAVQPGGPYVHIYPLVEVGGRWIALDATVNHPAGWEAAATRRLDLEL